MSRNYAAGARADAESHTVSIDQRMLWLKKKVCVGLQIEDERFDEFMQVAENIRSLRKFLDNETDYTSLLFYVQMENVEVEVHEEPPRPLKRSRSIRTASSASLARVAEAAKEAASRPSSGRDDTSETGASTPRNEDNNEENNRPKSSVSEKREGDVSSPVARSPIAPAKVPPKPTFRTMQRQKVVMSFTGYDEENNKDTRLMYMLRSTDDAVPMPASLDDADFVMCKHFEFGVIGGHVLGLLEVVLKEVYYPLLHHPVSNDTGGLTGASRSQADLLANLHKFAQHVAHTTQQVRGEITIHPPENIHITDPQSFVEMYLSDRSISDELNKVAGVWQATIQRLIKEEDAKERRGDGPLAEIEYWRTRSVHLSTLYEQCQRKEVEDVVTVLKLAEADIHTPLEYQLKNELGKKYILARDNVRFLNILERHFKILEAGTLQNIVETMLPMLNAIRWVWIISRYYRKDQHLEPLLERIRWQITERVSQEIAKEKLFDNNLAPEDAVKKIELAKSVLEAWQKSYMDVREKIFSSSDSGGDRWEFDRKKLFEKTNYMAAKCDELLMIAKALDEYKHTLGPELKAVTDPAECEKLVREVDSHRLKVLRATLDPFDKRYEVSWRTVKNSFMSGMEHIDAEVANLITSSFARMRSAYGTFQFLQTVQADKCRASVLTVLRQKTEQILTQFRAEVEKLLEIFETNKDDPPLTKNMPPVAGAIAWAHSLFLRMKKAILRFQSSAEMQTHPIYSEVRNKYLEVGKRIYDYETKLFKDWQTKADDRANQYLRGNILVRNKDGSYSVNFDPRLLELIRETKYMDSHGRLVPGTALNVALQEEKYHAYIEELKEMLELYAGVLSLLSPAEIRLLQDREIQGVVDVLQMGATQRNWKSLAVKDFIAQANTAIHKLQHIAVQLQRNANRVADAVSAIAGTVLVPQPPDDEEAVMELREFVDFMEKHRQDACDSMVNKYAQVSSTLRVIGQQIDPELGGSGASPLMGQYYSYWEVKVKDAVTKAVWNGLLTWHELLNVHVLRRKGKLPKRTTRPLVKVIALRSPRFITSPSYEELFRAFSALTAGVVASAKLIMRWKRGQCVEIAYRGDESQQHSLFPWVNGDVKISGLQVRLDEFIRRTTEGLLEKYLQSWNRYRTVWKFNKEKVIDKFAKKNPPCVAYDSFLANYQGIIDELTNGIRTKDIEFIRINLTPLIDNIKDLTTTWKTDYGDLLHKTSAALLNGLLEKMSNYEKNLSKPPDAGIDQLKQVLNVIQQIRDASMDMELAINDVQERYRTLRLPAYDLARPPNEELDQVDTLMSKWVQLVLRAKRVDESLGAVKINFTQQTREEVRAFQASVEKLKQDFLTEGPGAVGTDMDAGLALVERYTEILAQKRTERDALVLAEKLFNLEITAFPALVEVENNLKSLSQVYALYSQTKEAIGTWSTTRWADLDVTVLSTGIDKFMQKLKRLPKELRKLEPYGLVEAKIQGFKDSIPLFSNLKNDALRKRHWDKLMEVTGKRFDVDPKTFTLENLFAMELNNFKDVIEEIVSGASMELTFEKIIQDIADQWKVLRFKVQPYTRGAEDRGFVLAGTDEVTALLDDGAMRLSAMQASRFVAPHVQEVNQWMQRLSHIAEVTKVWMNVQRKWIYLESIFIGSGDIKMQLPDEAHDFEQIDLRWMKLMGDTAKTNNVLEACHAEARLAKLQSLLQDLERCQKSLSEYLESKRDAFPRFFFISDDELLSILGTRDANSVQDHMIKLYANTLSLNMITKLNTTTVLGMNSVEGEYLEFGTPVPAVGPVEVWMKAVEQEMRKSLRTITKQAVFFYPKTTRTKWIQQSLGMVSLTGSQIWWTWEVEDVFQQVRKGNKLAMKHFAGKLSRQLEDLVAMVRSDLTSNDRKKVNALIIVDVHARDVIDGFVRDSILDEKEFEWESQLRFYWDRTKDDIIIRQCTGQFEFGYEFQGLNGRLVITPLTDRCIMTLTQALSMTLGGSPAGPAGTGKTETVKDLAKAMGILCLVFNCGENFDNESMGRTFSGLAQTGSWGCFDEFNRIDPEVLSVVSSQIKRIQTAIISGQTTFDLIGRDIPLDRKCGIFVTMNPTYAGRSQLPDNLKSLFRPVVMVVPDNELICSIMLFSEGFIHAKDLAKKMTVLYKLSTEQLSRQKHYDFGLRAMKSVLVTAGQLKRGAPDKSEDEVLMRALRDMNMPKFVFEDVNLFRGLLQDLFPGLQPDELMNEKFNLAIVAALKQSNYQVIEEQVQKVKQLYDTMGTRHTTMVVGPTQGGKSVIIETLCKAQIQLGLNTKTYVINPKAMSAHELHGQLNPNTRDWTDGLLSNIFRDINTNVSEKREHKYIVFDGDVDTEWVENMNSVMDDSKILTLPNGERIRLQNHCKLLFEVGDLQYASHATVSRCGMVYCDPRYLGYKPFFASWCTSRPNKEQGDHLRTLFDKYVPRCINYIFHGILDEAIREKLRMVIPLTDVGMVRQLASMLESILTPEKIITDQLVLESIFIFCLVWSLGGALVEDARVKFDTLVKRLSDLILLETPGVLAGVGQLPTALPTLFEYFFNEQDEKWYPWETRVTPFVQPEDNKFYKILVPTVDTVRNTALLDMFVRTQKPILFVGESGTAKTVTIQNYLRGLPQETTLLLDVNFSSRTTARDLQRTLEASVEKHTKDTYGPRSGKRLIVFVDDLNMPNVDKYGTQQPIALLKLLFERGGMYDRGKDLNWKVLKGVQYVAAMAPPSGGRSAVDPRFISQFNVFNITFPSDDSLHRIYSSILASHVLPFSDEVQMVAAGLTEITLKLYRHIVQLLPPTPSKFHYIFNLRDLSRVFEGLCLSTVDTFNTSASFLRLWRNECLRVFHDRLINPTDQVLVQEKIEELLSEHHDKELEAVMAEPLLFGDFKTVHTTHAYGPHAPGDAKDPHEQEDPRLYQDLVNYDAIRAPMKEILDEYNDRHKKKMNLVLFDDALEHLTRLHRILRMLRGHAFLIGVDGSGRQSLTRLAAFLSGCAVFEISLTGGYNETSFREDLKKLYKMLGLENRKMVFLFTDAHVVDEGFLELINNMLTAGMPPALFADDERKELTNAAMADAVAHGAVDAWTYFVDKCRDNLHVVLSMSPAGETLRRRCRNFPGMVSNTVIDWFSQWPEQALTSVAESFLEDKVPAELTDTLVAHMVDVHLSVLRFSDEFETQLRRKNYCTPKNYLDFINNYLSTLELRRKTIGEQCRRLEKGLGKIADAGEQLVKKNKDLQDQHVALAERSKKVKVAMEQIKEINDKVATKHKAVQAKELELNRDQEQILVDKKEAEEALEEALPALREATAAVGDIDMAEVAILRSLAHPPKQVEHVCECVLVLIKGVTAPKDVSYANARAMLANSDFKGQLMGLIDTVSEISDRQVRVVKEILRKKNLADPATLAKVSRAAQMMLTWVLAIVYYCGVERVVRPRKEAVENAERNLLKSQKELELIKAEKRALTEQLENLEMQLHQTNAEKKKLQDEATIMERRLTAAQKLMSGLETEHVRWTADLEMLKQQSKRLVGDCMLSAAFLSYTGAFSFDYRQRMVYKTWHDDLLSRGIPLTAPFKIADQLVDAVETSRWTSEGLPADELSVQNGILTTRASRWPLCIDPQMQAVTWIKSREAKNNLRVLSFQDANFSKYLEMAITYGEPVLFEGVDENVDPFIDPVLEKNITVAGNRRFVVLGDKEVDWSPDFRLYLTTRMANPSFPPALYSKTMVINYSVTQQGLQSQLLNAVVRHEREELEVKREGLIKEMSDAEALLKQLEDTLLRELENAQQNMLDNDELIKTLQETKQKASEMKENLETAKTTSVEVERLREQYMPAATRGAVLFFALSALSNINSMYEFSLQSFMVVFKSSLRHSQFDAVLAKRLRLIIDAVTLNVYNYGCTGLFEKHRLLYSFQLCVKIQDDAKNMVAAELEFFLKGNTALEKSATKKPFEWVLEQGWEDLQRLVTLGPMFANLIVDLETNRDAWFTWYDSEAPEETPMPMGYSERLTKFQQLCVLKCFRIDRVFPAVAQYVIANMGAQYVTPPKVNMHNVYEQTVESSPVVVFILSPGADPFADLKDLAKEMDFTSRFKYLSLGQGQGPKAVALLETAIARGQWVMLMNCHLLTSWLKTLEKLLERLPEKVNENFRVWLTTEPTEKFPIGILQMSLKVVTEPPNGLKFNMATSFDKVSEETLSLCPHVAFRPIVYVLAFFHAVVQERRKYGKIGWNVSYDFNESDFRVSLDILNIYLTKAYKGKKDSQTDVAIPWGSLRYLIGECMYGGRVTDSFDRRILITYLNEYMGDFLFDTFQPFHFFQNHEFDYNIPATGPKANYTAAIDQLPQFNSPEVFGLHPNAEINYLTQSTRSLWLNMIQLQPQVAAGAGAMSRDEYVAGVAREILSKLPAAFDVPRISKAVAPLTPTPVQVVLLQELDMFNKLLGKMVISLRDLQKALAGEAGMSNELEALASALYAGVLPEIWRILAPETQKTLGNWIEHFLRRHRQYESWVANGEPACMWLAGLHIPEAYLTALVQTTCRANGWPLDRSTLFATVTQYTSPDQVPAKLESGCYVHGLFLEGAAWDIKDSMLRKQDPKVLVTELPVVQITPVETHKLKLQNTFSTPVYVTQERRGAMGDGLVFTADLRTTEHPSFWVLQGVALTLNVV